jgi:hypothetical protein
MRNDFRSLRKPVFADLVKFDLIQASGLVQIEELVRNALAKQCHVIGVDGHPNPCVEELSNRMCGKSFDPAKHEVGRGTDVEPNAMLSEKAHHSR